MRVGVEFERDAVAGRQGGGEGTPRRLHLGTRALDVVEVLDRWFGFDHTYIKLAAADGGTYILRHDAATDAWELVMFESGGGGDGRRG